MDSFRRRQLETFVTNLKALRKKKGWTQLDLAEECGFSEGAIKQLESFQRFPKHETLETLADCFGIKPEELLFDANPSGEDIAEKVYERLKKVMAGPIPEHLVKITDLLKKLDPKKDSVMLTQLESMLEGYLIRYEVPAKKTASRK